jgi:hypothetical protein
MWLASWKRDGFEGHFFFMISELLTGFIWIEPMTVIAYTTLHSSERKNVYFHLASAPQIEVLQTKTLLQGRKVVLDFGFLATVLRLYLSLHIEHKFNLVFEIKRLCSVCRVVSVDWKCSFP